MASLILVLSFDLIYSLLLSQYYAIAFKIRI